MKIKASRARKRHIKNQLRATYRRIKEATYYGREKEIIVYLYYDEVIKQLLIDGYKVEPCEELDNGYYVRWVK